MAGTCSIGNTKTISIQQSTGEAATYTILASNIFADGFTVDAIICDTQTNVGGSTLAVLKDATTILDGATDDAPATAGTELLDLTDTPANLTFAGTNNLVITTVGASKNRISIIVSEASPRSATVS